MKAVERVSGRTGGWEKGGGETRKAVGEGIGDEEFHGMCFTLR